MKKFLQAFLKFSFVGLNQEKMYNQAVKIWVCEASLVQDGYFPSSKLDYS